MIWYHLLTVAAALFLFRVPSAQSDGLTLELASVVSDTICTVLKPDRQLTDDYQPLCLVIVHKVV